MGTIVVNNLGKAYKQYPSRWKRLLDWVLPGKAKRHYLKWVLQDLNFRMSKGEAVGIIGINGAGKSTLLKLITGTTVPTAGSVQTSGRVAAMLELGMGFHPDFTGRQNAWMAGQLLGYSSEDMARLMPDIEAFAEIGDYIDQSVRVYSSGMQMRLAFSVATCMRPDVLIIDEALSVGDAYFQHKSFERIREFRRQGTSLLIVSHDKHAIQSICDRAILLSEGRLVMEGKPEAVMDRYNALLAQPVKAQIKQSSLIDGKLQTISGNKDVEITQVKFCNEQGLMLDVVTTGQTVLLRVKAKVQRPVDELVFGFLIKDRMGMPIYGSNTHHTKQVLRGLKPGKDLTFNLKIQATLGPGTYSIALALHAGHTHVVENFEWRDLAVVFEVINADRADFVGVAWLPHEIEIRE
jgi:lipopolysaccharide transport system ATP-binding protein